MAGRAQVADDSGTSIPALDGYQNFQKICATLSQHTTLILGLSVIAANAAS